MNTRWMLKYSICQSVGRIFCINLWLTEHVMAWYGLWCHNPLFYIFQAMQWIWKHTFYSRVSQYWCHTLTPHRDGIKKPCLLSKHPCCINKPQFTLMLSCSEITTALTGHFECWDMLIDANELSKHTEIRPGQVNMEHSVPGPKPWWDKRFKF